MKITLRSMYDSFPPTYGDSNKQVNFYVDNNVYFLEDKDDPDAICLLVEPRAIIPMTYKWVEEHFTKFRYIFTFDSRMLTYPNAKLLIYGQITAEFPTPHKTKNISMVCSDKDFCEGHLNRQRVARELTSIIDTFGKFSGNYADDKTIYDGYRFNVAMENYQDGHYFTEKICNCFASRIVPIYYGCPNIGEYFDTDGIVICDSPDDVIVKVQEILKDPVTEYNKRICAVEDNYERVQKYRSYAKLFLEMYADLLEEG